MKQQLVAFAVVVLLQFTLVHTQPARGELVIHVSTEEPLPGSSVSVTCRTNNFQPPMVISMSRTLGNQRQEISANDVLNDRFRNRTMYFIQTSQNIRGDFTVTFTIRNFAPEDSGVYRCQLGESTVRVSIQARQPTPLPTRPPCVQPTCQRSCPLGHERDMYGCMTCDCWHPCKSTECPESQECRAEYICRGNVCQNEGVCYDAEEACSSPALFNPRCSSPTFSDRYFYDSEKGECLMFTWNGCGTHKNNFKLLEDCQVCIPKKVVPTCAPPPVVKICRYGFIVDANGCTTDTCTDNPCKISRCTESESCLATRRCTSQSECHYVAKCVQPVTACSLPMAVGSCRQSHIRFFYDAATASCKQFTYRGCGGNDNQFVFEEDCEAMCSSLDIPRPTCTPILCLRSCEFGLVIDARGCKQCQCKPHPCQGYSCPSEQKCVLNEEKQAFCQVTVTPRPTCSSLMCMMFCQFGFKEDENGCPVCECKLSPCQDFQCPSNQECVLSDDQLPGCQDISSSSTEGCSPITCMMFCKFGFEQDEDGCDICRCKRHPCLNFECPADKRCALTDLDKPQCINAVITPTTPSCSQRRCMIFCKFGFKKDTNGCELCECARDPCQTFVCPSNQQCVLNEEQEPICQTVSTPRPTCSPIMCMMFCQFGFRNDDNGCPLCECNPHPCQKFVCPSNQQCVLNEEQEPICQTVSTPRPTCSPIMCMMFCQFGFRSDDNGCPLCECNLDPCQNFSCPGGQSCTLNADQQPQCTGTTVAPCPALDCNDCAAGCNTSRNDMGCTQCNRDPCDTHSCPYGKRCHLQEVQCSTFPCLPVPVCVDHREVCSLPPVTGRCMALIPRWHHNRDSDSCEPFVYGGCDGNNNRFTTRRACNNLCAIRPSCGLLVCRKFCQHSYRTDRYGCQTCNCKENACEDVTCEQNKECMIENEAPCSTCQYHPRCLTPTKITKLPEDQHLTPGESVYFDCVVDSDQEMAAEVTWFYNGKPLDMNDEHMSQFPNNTLRCSTEDLEEQGEEILGTYECVADNGYSRAAASARLDLAPPPPTCSSITCLMSCGFGFQTDENGCSMCVCKPDPCEEVECPGGEVCVYTDEKVLCQEPLPTCKPIPASCRLNCKFGFQRDVNGCQQCSCRDNPCIGFMCGPDLRCEVLNCISDQECPAGTPSCIAKLEPIAIGLLPTTTTTQKITTTTTPVKNTKPNCPALECDEPCSHGHHEDQNGCPSCICVDPCEGYTCNEGFVCVMEEFERICRVAPRTPERETETVTVITESAYKHSSISHTTAPTTAAAPTTSTVPTNATAPSTATVPTTVAVTSVSPSPSPCPTVWCYNRCPFGYAIDASNCTTCQCHEPCKHTNCSDGQTCISTKDGTECIDRICPMTNNTVCWQDCAVDSDCLADSICCLNQCDMGHCVKPLHSKDEKLDCQKEKHQAMAVVRVVPGSNQFIPRCQENGKYAKIQCQENYGVCWCVNEETGQEITGTRVRGYPDCVERGGPEVCNLTRKSETCRSGFRTRWFYNVDSQKCEAFTFQCQGNQNNFYTERQCQSYCHSNRDDAVSCGDDKVHKCSRWLCRKYERYLPDHIHCSINPCGGCGVQFYDQLGGPVLSGIIRSGKTLCERRKMEVDMEDTYHEWEDHLDEGERWDPRDELYKHYDACDQTQEKPPMPRNFSPQCGHRGNNGVNSKGFFHRQCGGQYCWCVDDQGQQINGTLSPADHCLVCDEFGAVNHTAKAISCYADLPPSYDSRICLGFQCITPDGTPSYCTFDACNGNRIFVDSRGQEVLCKEVIDRRSEVCDEPRPANNSQEMRIRWYNINSTCISFTDHSIQTVRTNSFNSLQTCMEQCSAHSGDYGDSVLPKCNMICPACAEFPEAVCVVDNPCISQYHHVNPASGRTVDCSNKPGYCDKVNAYTVNSIHNGGPSIYGCHELGDTFRPLQCWMDHCWCVDDKGRMLKGSRKHFTEGKPDCGQLRIIQYQGALEFKNADFRELYSKNGGKGFETAVIDSMSNTADLPSEHIRIVNAWSGSVNMVYEIDTLLNDSYIDNVTIGKIHGLEQKIRAGGFLVVYDGSTYYANHRQGVYVAENPQAEPVVPAAVTDDSFIGEAAIIAIAVVAALLLILAIIIACICAHKKETKRIPKADSKIVMKRRIDDPKFATTRTLIVDFDEEYEPVDKVYHVSGTYGTRIAVEPDGDTSYGVDTMRTDSTMQSTTVDVHRYNLAGGTHPEVHHHPINAYIDRSSSYMDDDTLPRKEVMTSDSDSNTFRTWNDASHVRHY